MAVVNVEDLIVVRRGRENLIQMVAVGVGNEYLSELVTGHQADDLLHAFGVQFVEDVVEQE